MYLICLHNIIRGIPDAFDRKCSRISVDDFELFLDRLQPDFRLIPFSEYLDRLKSGRPDPRAVALSFDDGFTGVYRYALPALEKRGVDAVVFANPPQLGNASARIFHFLEIEICFRLTQEKSFEFQGTSLPLTTLEEKVKAMRTIKKKLKASPDQERAEWHARMLAELGLTPERIRAFSLEDEKFSVMSREELRDIDRRGWTVAPHTLSHRALAWLSDAEAENEILGSKRGIEALIGKPCEIFAYPYGEYVHFGDVAPRICERAGFLYSFTTISGENCQVSKPQLLNRYDYKDFVRFLESRSGKNASG